MILPRLGRRLGAILELAPRAAAVADIGAGHGALSVHLAAAGVPRVIATEAALGPIEELRANLRRWRAERQVEVRLGAGLDPLAPAEVEGAIVAGMGARTMLEACGDARGRGLGWLILQCMQRGELVEPGCRARGWRILDVRDATQAGRDYRAWLVEVGP